MFPALTRPVTRDRKRFPLTLVQGGRSNADMRSRLARPQARKTLVVDETAIAGAPGMHALVDEVIVGGTSGGRPLWDLQDDEIAAVAVAWARRERAKHREQGRARAQLAALLATVRAQVTPLEAGRAVRAKRSP